MNKKNALAGPAVDQDPYISWVYKICRFGVWGGGILFIIAAIIVCIEIIIRKTFGATIGGADEISGYVLAVASAWAYGFALLERAHIRIDTLYVVIPVRIAALLDMLALIAFLAFFSLVTWHAFEVLYQTVALGSRSMTPLETPLVLPQSLWFLGMCTVVITALALILRAGFFLLSGKPEKSQNLIGSRSVKNELQREKIIYDQEALIGNPKKRRPLK